jgi:repressor LexA
MNFGKQLAYLRKENKLTQEDLANILNLSVPTVKQWEKKETNPTLTVLSILRKRFNLPADYFFENEVDTKEVLDLIQNYKDLEIEQRQVVISFMIFLNEENKRLKKKSLTVFELPQYRRKELFKNLYYGTKASAGHGTMLQEEEAEIIYTDFPLKPYDGIAMVDGESMNRTFKNGSYCTFKHTGFDRDGDFYAVSEGDLTQENLYIKQVFWDKERQQYRLHSTNPDYQDFWLGEEDGVIIAGAVIQNFEAIDESQIED